MAALLDKIAPTEIENEREKLLTQKSLLEKRLYEISGPPLPSKSEWIAKRPEVHWDSLLQELVCLIIYNYSNDLKIWLSNDFTKERQRHLGNGKKLSRAVEVYHSTKQIRLEKKVKVGSFCCMV
jgi:hypothetical protein